MKSTNLISSIAETAKRFHENDSTGHDWWHVYRVWQLAKHIAVKENANIHLVEMAALLHDMDDWKLAPENDKKNEYSNARKLLIECAVDSNSIEKVIGIIKEVSFKGANVDTTPTSIEACVVQDADRLDAIGAIGIARAFAYGGSKGRPLFDPNCPSVLHSSFAEYKNSKGSTLNHFYEKLLLLKDMLNTQTAIGMAEKRHKYMEQFVSQFLNEWNVAEID